MTYATCCSGIEAVSVAVEPLGWRAAWFSEIDPFCCALLATKYPGVRNVGDMTKVTESDLERCDVLVAGTPCQSFSVAGLRGGLADARGNLALRFFQIAGVVRPRWVVWENVPGCLSSDGGRDFGAILGALGELGYGFAYRVLDAQFVRVDGYSRAVPQRRRRVFVVGCLGDWRRAAAVLFDSESLYGNSPPCRTSGERVAGPIAGCSNGGGANGPGRTADDADTLIVPEISPAMKSRDSKGVSSDGDGDGDGLPLVVAHSLKAEGHDAGEDGTGRGVPLVFNWQAGGSAAMLSPGEIPTALKRCQTPAIAFQTRIGRNGRGQPKDVVDALTSCAAGTHADSKPHVAYSVATIEAERYDTGHDATQARSIETLRLLWNAIGEEAFIQWCAGILAPFWPKEVLRPEVYGFGVRREAISFNGLVYLSSSRAKAQGAWPLRTLWEAACVGCPPSGWGRDEQRCDELATYLSELPYSPSPAEKFMCLVWEAGEGSRLLRQALSAIQEARRSACVQAQPTPTSHVRRLTVEECEALQGFPRGYTQILYRKKPAADAPRYKALGNSMAVNVMRWILERIANEP